MNVGNWLRALGLEQYEASFRQHAIDDALLPSLTAEDLKDLGITAVGHRRKLLNAIAALRGDSSAIPLDPAPALDPPHRKEGPERRHVTVMFSDLVGSTALAASMDPEDLREIIGAYQKCVTETVHRFDGFVARFLGDGVLVYFGYPDAHEDDAERAVRAALEVIEAVSALNQEAPLQTRVGIATGLVIIGDLIGSGDAHEHDIVGETPYLAARLQAVAEPNMVVIADDTRRLLGNLFQLRDLGAKELKGITGPVRVWAALAESAVESRFEALHAIGPLVGREQETELLLKLWSQARSGKGQVALLAGETGIGKSRLTVELMERLADEQLIRLRYFCSPQHSDSPLYPVIRNAERAAGFALDDTPQAKLDKLHAILRLASTPMEDAALFAEMLSLPNDGRYPALNLPPQQRRQRTLQALNDQVARLAKQKPLVMIFEDVHWIDPTTLEAMHRCVQRIKSLRALLIVTFRPEFDAPWEGAHVTRLTLNRLGRRESAEIIAGITGIEGFSPDLTAEIVERTDGIPLFVEEMTKAVMEAKTEVESRQSATSNPGSTLAVPASLHASLLSRLDRLGAAKKVAQIGAAIGREFPHALVAALMGELELELVTAIDRLVAAGLLTQQGVPPEAVYLFKHALVQDAAYGTLLREQRRVLHGRIAEALEREFPDLVRQQPELLARHCTEAKLIDKAAGLWGKAGGMALERSALVEAGEHLTRALNQMAALPLTPELRRQQIRLQVALITPLVHVKGYGAPETKAAAERAHLLIEEAEALGEPPEDPLLLFSVLYGLWAGNYLTFKGDVLREAAAQFLALAKKQGDTTPLMIGHRLTGVSLLHAGDIAEARVHLDRSLPLYEPSKHRQLAMRFGQDVRVAILFYRAFALWVLGYPEAAVADCDRALREAHDIGQAATLMPTLALTSLTHIHCGNYTKASELLDMTVALANEKGASFWKAGGMALQGCVWALTGKAAEAVDQMTSALNAWRATGATLWIPVYLSYLTRAYAETGRFDDAWRCIDEALVAVRASKETWYEAVIYRVAGEIALMSPTPDTRKAESYFDRALAVARKQRAKSWELRAAMSLARLWRDQGMRDEARGLLAPVYAWFTEGFDTLDLKQAKMLLEELEFQQPADA